MIPRKVTLKNFLSYGPKTVTVDFSPYQCICLSGKNGHGKSALLDAITWALWGQARKVNGVARSEEHLVHLGQDHMMISFDFEIHEAIYRVTREYSKIRNKKTLSELQFGVLNEITNEFTPCTGKTTRETQEQIISTISLSFEGCINSIFLRQGQSHEFSKKSPQERKEILSSILGFSHLETYRENTLAIIRELNKKQYLLTNQIEQLQEKTKQLQYILAEKKEIEEALTQSNSKQKTIIHNITLTEQIQEQYHQQQQQKALLFQEKKIILDAQSAATSELHKLTTEWKNIRQSLAKIKNKNNKDECIIIETQLDAIQEKKDLLLALINKKQQITVQIALQAQTLEQNYIRQKQELQLQKQSIRINLTHQKEVRQTIHSQITCLNAELTNIVALSTTETENLQKIGHQKESLQKLKNTNQLLEKKQHTAASLNQIAVEQEKKCQQTLSLLFKAQAVCPTCKQGLTENTQHQVIQQTKRQEQKCIHQSKRAHQHQSALKERIKTVVLRIQEAQNNLQMLETLHIQHQAAQQKKTSLQEAILQLQTQYTKAAEEVKNLESSYLLIEEQITSAETNYTAQKTVALESPLQKTWESLGNTEKEYLGYLQKQNEQELQERLKNIKEQENAAQNRAILKQNKKNLAALIQKHLSNVRLLQKKHAAIEYSIHSREFNISDQQLVLLDLRNTLTKEHQLYSTLISKESFLQAQIKQLEQDKEQLAHLQREQQALIIHLDEYMILSNALSKNGIQALLIEYILPELELETNAILQKLSENNTQIIFESVKDLKNGSSKETLDIHISDAMGVRPYELFSGGEAFRIDFALRIALSKLLAKRSGKPLQTLIIDEGFGSQDEQGLEKILEALQKIQSDFAKIIIVSHLQEMKTQFAANFIVEKHPTGSNVTIIEQW